MTLYHGPNIISNSLVACFDCGNQRSYTGSGTSWKDISNSGYSATLYGSPTYDTTKGGGLIFNLSSSQYATTTIPSWPSDFTLEIWTKPGNSSNTQAIVSNNSSGSSGSGVYISSNQLIFFIYYSSGSSTTITTSSLTVGTPQYIVCTKSGTAMTMYSNNNQVGTATLGGSSIYQTSSLTFAYQATIGNYFSGTLYQIRIHSRGLSNSEISHNFAAHRGRYGI